MHRLVTFVLGRAAERAAVRHLRRQGYRFIERNVRLGRDEIDAVFVHDRMVVFVEVRYRSSGVFTAAQSVDTRKSKSLARAVRAYRAREGLRRTAVRIDVLAVTRQAGRWSFVHEPGAVAVEGPSALGD